MLQLIYASTAVRRFEDEDLHALVKHLREKNDRLGITGVLVYRNGSFLQVLEGEEQAVRALYDTICTDERHQWVTLLKDSPIEERDFPGTPMAFRDRSMMGARRRPLGVEEKEEQGDAEREAPLLDAEGPREGPHEGARDPQRRLQRADVRPGGSADGSEAAAS